MSSAARVGSKTERLRHTLAGAKDERARLAALLALARHFAEVSDGVNGLDMARRARTLALELGDWGAVTQALQQLADL